MKKKTIITVLAVVLAFALGVGGTIAFLTAESSKVTNTFVVGKIQIKLEEHDTGKSDGTVVTSRENIKVVPGAEIDKDPFVTVLKDSENCYVYAKVTNNLKAGDPAVTVATLTPGTGWSVVATSGDVTLYKYASIVSLDAQNDQVLAPVFTTVTISEDVTAETITALNSKTIEIEAYAHQSDNTDEATATAAAKAWAGIQ